SIGALEYHPGRGAFRNWLFTIVRRKLCDWQAARARRVNGTGDTAARLLLGGCQAPQAAGAAWQGAGGPRPVARGCAPAAAAGPRCAALRTPGGGAQPARRGAAAPAPPAAGVSLARGGAPSR